jgi:hypothetical protein
MIALNRRTLAPRLCVSKDATRHNLCALHFSEEGVTVGTTGHLMAVVTPAIRGPIPRGFGLEDAALADAVRATKKKNAPDVELHATDTPRRWNVGGVEHSEIDAAPFPKWRTMHPKKHAEPKHTLEISLHVLEAMTATARAFAGGTKGEENCRLTIELPADPIRPIRVHTADKDSGDVLGFTLMPMRNPSK